MVAVTCPRKSRQPRARFIRVTRKGQDLAGEFISCDGGTPEKRAGRKLGSGIRHGAGPFHTHTLTVIMS